MKGNGSKSGLWLPLLVAIFAAGVWAGWWLTPRDQGLKPRVPGTDLPAGMEPSGATNPVLAGQWSVGEGRPANLPGDWPQFRGPNRDGISPEKTPLTRNFGSTGPLQLWAMDVGEGYASAAVRQGRVYVMDYDRDRRQDALRCLSLADGREIWRYAYPVAVKRNHGMSRTVPAVTDQFVVAMGPKCHVVCADAVTGKLRWGLDLVRQYGATVPPWYTGQCPLIENGCAILAPGGPGALLMAVDCDTGAVRWQTPNPRGWKMTHSSVMPMEFAGRRLYVYCASGGVVGVDAADGRELWATEDWKISIATIPSPLVLPGGKIFLSGGYNAGSLMLQLENQGGRLTARPLFRLGPEVFGATQHTPIFYENHIYGVRPDGQFVCLDLNGKLVWASGPAYQFGLGPFLMADGMFWAMDGNGRLRVFEATAAGFKLLTQAQVLTGRESWGPMALADGRLLVRDLTRMACLDVTSR